MRSIQIIQRMFSSSMILSNFIVIKLCLPQSFCLIAAARMIISSIEKSLFILIVSQTSIFINLKTLNSRALMKKLFINNTKSSFEERFLHNCIIIKNDEMSFHLLIEKFNYLIVINSLILVIWTWMSTFWFWNFHILTSNLRDEEKINEIIILTQIVQLEIHFCRLAD